MLINLLGKNLLNFILVSTAHACMIYQHLGAALLDPVDIHSTIRNPFLKFLVTSLYLVLYVDVN